MSISANILIQLFNGLAKSGVLAVEPFFDILQLNGIALTEPEKTRIATKGKGRGPNGAAG